MKNPNIEVEPRKENPTARGKKSKGTEVGLGSYWEERISILQGDQPSQTPT